MRSAHTAFYDGRWSRLSPAERSEAIYTLGRLLADRAADFAKVESEDTGKPYESMSL